MRIRWTIGHVAFLLASLALVVLSVQASGASVGDAAAAFLRGSVASPTMLAKTFRELTPLILAGLAVFIALRAGLFNVGADGQLIMGALCAATIGIAMPNLLGMVLGIVAAAAAGGAWAYPAVWIKLRRGGHEVISTIMLNNIARLLTLFLVKGPLKDPGRQGQTTVMLPETAWAPDLPALGGVSTNLSLIIALMGLVAAAIWLNRSIGGFELSATGANPRAAALAGVNVNRTATLAMVSSGGLAGIAGAFLVLGQEHRFYANFSPGYGFDALGVALIAGQSVGGILIAGALFAIVSTGTSAIQVLGIPRGLSGMLLGLALLMFGALTGTKARTNDD